MKKIMYGFAGSPCHLAEISEHIYFLNLSEVDSRHHSRMAAVSLLDFDPSTRGKLLDELPLQSRAVAHPSNSKHCFTRKNSPDVVEIDMFVNIFVYTTFI